MLIGEFAKKSGLTREGIRFYEKMGLLTGERMENHYRMYSDEELGKVHFIHHLKELGFILPEIREIMSLFSSELKCRQVENKFATHLQKVEEKLVLLKNIKERLTNSIQLCRKNPDKRSCITLEKFHAKNS